MDNVNHPEHYKRHPSGIECIQITEHMSFNLGNAIKYIWRHEGKGGIEDLRKAIWYINREIERVDKSCPLCGGDVPCRQVRDENRELLYCVNGEGVVGHAG